MCIKRRRTPAIFVGILNCIMILAMGAMIYYSFALSQADLFNIPGEIQSYGETV